MKYEVVIGLEIHAQLKTESKIFCGCSTRFGAEPNSQTCPVCAGMPGALPVLNRNAVEYAMKAGIATNCQINRNNRFDRKSYFYPDLPAGYQISQFELPIAENGHVDIALDDGSKKRIRINRIHMENDAGKSSHDPYRPVSFVDLNRAGMPLIEIVSEADMRSAEEAGAFMRKIHSILRWIDVCDGNMEEGSLRCDANVSLRLWGAPEFGVRTEMKNLNSFRNIERAILSEVRRQADVLDDGGVLTQETRLWNADEEISVSMRSKEDAHDYRYFPDSDLPPVIIDDDFYNRVKDSIPELPEDRKNRYTKTMGLSDEAAAVLTSSIEISSYFENCLSLTDNPKQVANWVIGPVMAMINARGITISESPVSEKDLVDLLELVEKSVISGTMAKTVFEEMAQTGKQARAIVDEKGLAQVSDTSEIEGIVDMVLKDNPGEVEAYKAGKTKLMGFFVGQVMRASKGKANPAMVNEIVVKKLEG